jgi:hypothetical protein
VGCGRSGVRRSGALDELAHGLRKAGVACGLGHRLAPSYQSGVGGAHGVVEGSCALLLGATGAIPGELEAAGGRLEAHADLERGHRSAKRAQAVFSERGRVLGLHSRRLCLFPGLRNVKSVSTALAGLGAVRQFTHMWWKGCGFSPLSQSRNRGVCSLILGGAVHVRRGLVVRFVRASERLGEPVARVSVARSVARGSAAVAVAGCPARCRWERWAPAGPRAVDSAARRGARAAGTSRLSGTPRHPA